MKVLYRSPTVIYLIGEDALNCLVHLVLVIVQLIRLPFLIIRDVFLWVYLMTFKDL